MILKKSIFREDCLKKLNTSSMHNKIYKDAVLNKKLLSVLHSTTNKTILFFHPMQREANILKTLYKKRKDCKIFLPFMQSKSLKMTPFRLPLEKKKFGIYESKNSLRSIDKVDIAVVPVVGIDGDYKRVGYGKGMYDRFFDSLHNKPFMIFIQVNSCYTKEKICQNYDISCDIFLSFDKSVNLNKRERRKRCF